MGETPDRDDEISRVREVYATRKRKRSPGQSSYGARLRQYDRAFETVGLLPMAEVRVLDVGCSNGNWLDLACRRWDAAPAHCSGLDVRDDKIEEGRAAYPGIELLVASADDIPHPDAKFDLVHHSMMFSSVLDAGFRTRIAEEMWRVLKPGGYIGWFDFILNPINPNAKGIGKRKMLSLFPQAELKFIRRIGLLPPLARVLDRCCRPLVTGLSWLKVLNCYYIAILQKPAQTPKESAGRRLNS